MNNIAELVDIIYCLGGTVSFTTICEEYQKRNKIVLSSNHRITLSRTLKDHPELVCYDDSTNNWSLCVSQRTKVAKKSADNTVKIDESIAEVFDILKNSGELIPEKYDGSYVWMKAAIDEYSKLDDFSAIDVSDMDFIYSLAIGTWKMSINIKKDRLDKTNLGPKSIQRLKDVIDDVWDSAVNKKYIQFSPITDKYDVSPKDSKDRPKVGMFGTGFMTFKGKLNDADARSFIKMMVDIRNLDDSEQLYSVCEQTLNKDYVGKGLKSAAASAILHCFKPFSFPILNSNEGQGTIYNLLGIQLDKNKALYSYITNCRRIKEYRDRTFNFKNYRILDISMWKIANGDKFDLAGYLADTTEKVN